MSRIGKLPVVIPKGVTINIKDDLVTVKGPKGQLTQKLLPGFRFEQTATDLNVLRPNDDKQSKSLHGLYRRLIHNMAVGVSDGYELTMELVGVGYRVEAKGQVLDFALGFSHQIFFLLPPEVQASVVSERGQNPRLTLKGIDKQLLGQVAAKIRSLRPPEPYKGKGIRFLGENVRRKAGKTSGKGKK